MTNKVYQKVCCTCKQTLLIDNFNKAKREKDGYRKQCKSCRKVTEKASRDRLKNDPEWAARQGGFITCKRCGRERYVKCLRAAKSKGSDCFACNADKSRQYLAQPEVKAAYRERSKRQYWNQGGISAPNGYNWRVGANSIHWKGGRPRCIDCNKELGSYKKMISRCRACYGVTRRAENNSRWIGGLPNCLGCGKQLSSYTVKRCQPCYHAYKTGENHPNWKGGKSIRNECVDCGTKVTFISTRCVPCSSKVRTGENNFKWQKDRHRCVQCGKELRQGKKSVRCRECHFQNHPFSGENNPQWKGGVTSQTQKERGELAVKHWRKEVFKKDNHTCRLCNARGGKLHAHHIKKWSTHKEVRTDVNNGVTLCQDCHLNIVHQGNFKNEPLDLWN